MDLPRPATSEDRERRSAAGRTATSCPICDTPSGASGGHRAVFKVSIISSSEYSAGSSMCVHFWRSERICRPHSTRVRFELSTDDAFILPFPVVTPPVACTTLLTRTKPWAGPCPGRSSRWTPSAGGIGGRPPASRTNASAPSCSASTRPAGTAWRTDRPPRDPPAAMDK